MAIKKSYVELVNLLENNKDKKVSTLLDKIYSLCESKKQQQTFLKDKDGKVFAIFCYYHKQWELLKDVPYGSKKNSTTGFNTMCKIGTSKWTKAQRDSKNNTTLLLTNIANGKANPKDILKLQADIEETRKTMNVTDMPKGYKEEEDIPK